MKEFLVTLRLRLWFRWKHPHCHLCDERWHVDDFDCEVGVLICPACKPIMLELLQQKEWEIWP